MSQRGYGLTAGKPLRFAMGFQAGAALAAVGMPGRRVTGTLPGLGNFDLGAA
jgi:hypothetical protein